MKITDMTDKTVTIEMTHKQALMIMALMREICFGAVLFHDEFDTRVGCPIEDVDKTGSELHDLLYEVGISEQADARAVEQTPINAYGSGKNE